MALVDQRCTLVKIKLNFGGGKTGRDVPAFSTRHSPRPPQNFQCCQYFGGGYGENLTAWSNWVTGQKTI